MSHRIVPQLLAAVLAIAAVASGCAGPNSASRQGQTTIAAEPGPVDADAPEQFTQTASGLKYRVRRKSEGRKPAAQDSVTVHYRGWLDNGTEFDSSYGGQPATFQLDQVIAGWTEGLQHVGEGGMIELEIPAELGYGPQGAGPIPPNARLHFIVELVAIN